MSKDQTRSRSHRRALALIVVVYVLGALGTLAFALAFRSKVGLCQTQLLVDRAQQDEIALAVCAQARRLLAIDDPNVDSVDDVWFGWRALEMPRDFSGGNVSGQIWWRLVDESSKINVNQAPSDVLSRIDGLDQAAVASILDWIDEDDLPNPDGAEEAYYASLSPGYACRNGSLESLEELTLIKGITADLYFGSGRQAPSFDHLALGHAQPTADEEDSAGLCELLTVYGDGRINLNTALPGVLKAIPLLSEAAVSEILLQQRVGGRTFATQDDILTNDVFSDTDEIVLLQVAKFNSSHFQLQIKARFERMNSTCEYAAVLARDEAAVSILRWQRELSHEQNGYLRGVADLHDRMRLMD